MCIRDSCEAAQLRTPRTPSSLGPLCRAPPCDAAQRLHRTEPARHALLGILPDMRDIRRPTQDGRARGANVGESRCAENRSTGAGGRQSAPSSPQNMPWSTPHPTYRTIHHPMRAGHPGDRPEPRPPNPRNMPWSTSRPTYPTFRRPTQDGRARGADAGASRCVKIRSKGVLRQDPEHGGVAPRSGARGCCAKIRSRGVMRRDPEERGAVPRPGAKRRCAEIRSREGVSR